MQLSFEKQKNIKASVYTTIICVALYFVFFLLQWKQAAPIISPPKPQFMEVNLGNSATGSGEIAPMSNDAPAPKMGASKFKKASAINKLVKTNAKNLPLPANTKPKAIMGKYAGGNGKGGNNQDSYNNVKDQGIAGGKGDQGVSNGNINGKSYSGNGGPFVTKGDRHVTKIYAFNGDVEAATIYAEIEVSPIGVGRFIQIVKGSSSNDAKYKRAITEYLTKIEFNTADHSSMVTVKFKFEVQ